MDHDAERSADGRVSALVPLLPIANMSAPTRLRVTDPAAPLFLRGELQVDGRLRRAAPLA
jgi:hypothetical protein